MARFTKRPKHTPNRPEKNVSEYRKDFRWFKGVLGVRSHTTEAMYPVPPMFLPPWEQLPEQEPQPD